MELKKKSAFNQRMGRHAKHQKKPTHLNLAKGGVVKRFDTGGVATTNGGVTNTQGAPQGITGAISNLLGTNNNFQAGTANLTPGTNAGQLNTAYGGVNNAIGQQQNLTNTLTPQAGSAVADQNALAGQYLAMSQGQGPNPALTQLNQTTGQNVANTAAEMAGQRGASSNVGLIARQAAQQGAATQQNAVGQAATLEAQQQIAAQQNLANLANNQINQTGTATTALNTAQQNEQNTLQGANTANNNALVGEQSNLNNVNASVAAGNQSQNTGILGGLASAASNIPVVGGLFKGFLAHGGEVSDAPKMAAGGIAPNPLITSPAASAPAAGWAGSYMASGASAAPNVASSNIETVAGQQKSSKPTATASSDSAPANGNSDPDNMPDYASQLKMPQLGDSAMAGSTAPQLAHGGSVYHPQYFQQYFAKGGVPGGQVDAIVSPKEVYLNPRQVKEVVERGADPIKIGHHFPGQDKVKGRDSYKNDVIKTKLEDGGVVIPVHITTHKEASERGRKFVTRAIAKHMKRPARMN